jgi:hypothetical protein
MSNTFQDLLDALASDRDLANSVAAAPVEERHAILEGAGITVPSKEEQDAYLAEHPDALSQIEVDDEVESIAPLCAAR